MNKDTPLLEVTIEDNAIVGYGKIFCQELMPLRFLKKFDLQSLNNWFVKRQIPDNREGKDEVQAMFPDAFRNRHFFSLSDQYWVKYTADDTWAQYNPFTNRYNDEVGRAFFEPWLVDRERIGLPSPDRTTNGVLRKRWTQDDDGISYLIKAGSVKFHQEPLSEVLASITLRNLDIIKFVSYELVIEGMRFCSKCKNFVTQDTEFIPAADVFMQEPRLKTTSIYDHLINMCAKFKIPGAKEFIDNMIVADRILCNDDRHLGNFGFIRSVATGEIYGPAPLFDCGSAYWGTTNDVKKRTSKLFSDKEAELMDKAAKRNMVTKGRSTPQMTKLIKMYPDITDTKKEEILTMIQERDLEIEQMSGNKLNERDKEEDKKFGAKISHPSGKNEVIIEF